MIALLKWILARWALFKLLLRSFGALAWLLPLAMLLKALGWPVLVVLAIVALPLLVVLAVIGLPLLLVAAGAGIMLAIVFWVITTGLLLIKIAVPILLVAWLVRRFRRWNRGDDGSTETRRGQGSAEGGAADSTESKPSGSAGSDMPESGFAEA